MKGCKLILLFLFCCIISITLSAQDREQLEQERMQVIESIEATDDLIASSEADRQKGIATLVALRGQIDQRNTLLNNIKQSISAAEFEIEFNLATLDSLTQRVKSIKDQYAILLRFKYVRRLIGSKWITIFSTSNINKAFLRWNYYRQFDTYRESKIKEIESIQKIVAQKNKEIKKHAIENSALIQEQQQQNSELQKRIEQQNELIKELQKDKTILQSQLLVIKEARESLNQAIESRVINELSGVKIGSDRGKSNESNPVIVKGKIMLPITNGYIENFSISDEDKTSTISLSVAKGARVISIAPGRVVSVKDVSGFGRMIILQHGDYYSVYAKMNNVIVSVGNRVEKNTVLGSVDSTENKLHFELWKDKVRLDANKWIEE